VSTEHATEEVTVETTPIVFKIDGTPNSATRMPDDVRIDRDILIHTVAETEDGMRKRAVVDSPAFPGVAWSIACDEGPRLGGSESAPPPLSYFAAGVAFCLLTQLTRYHEVKKLKVRSIGLEQTMRFRRTGSVLAGTFEARALELRTVLDVRADEDPDTVAEIVRIGEQMCFAAQAITQEVPSTVEVLLNGHPLSNVKPA
jgi:uncharacterized OsmC-like protein